MFKQSNINNKIEELRAQLQILVDNAEKLYAEEIVIVSQKLDQLIDAYYLSEK